MIVAVEVYVDRLAELRTKKKMAGHGATVGELKARGYKEGSIVRVHMHNFISYDDAVVFPGPKLNIILGPNGTGKSALTHAICLTCCGSIKSVGRSDDTSEYVKRNSADDISFCEVDLLRHDSIVTVRRYLSKDNSSSKWAVNGKPITQAQVKQLMASLNIDLNNLCSFMPQDRVGAFTQQSAKGILEKTLESIKSSGERNLHQEQMELAEEQRTSQDRGREKDTQQGLVNNLQLQLDGMKSEVERIRQRAVLEEKLKMFEVKIVVKELQEAGKRLKELQAAVDEATRTYATAKEGLKPLEGRVRELQKQQATFETTIRSSNEKKKKSDEEVERAEGELNECDLAVENCKAEIETLNRSRQQLESKLVHVEKEIRNLEASYQEALDRVSVVQSKIQEMNDELNQETINHNNINSQISDLQFSMREPNLDLEGAQRELDSLRDPREIFCSRLSDREQDVAKAYRWINANKQRFHGECYGPIGMEIRVKKSLGAEHILEKFVPRAKLLSFLVENREDELLLNEELRVKRRLTININTMYNRGTHQSPYSPSFLEQGRAWGLQGMIADLYEMPDLVRAYLNTFLAFHCCLWSKCPSSTLSSDILSSLCLNKQFRLFVVETKMQNREEQVADITEMSGKVSRYNPNAPPSTVSEPVRPAQLIQTGGADITEKKERLEHVIAAARAKVEDIKRQIDQHRAENQRCQDRITQIRSSLGKAKAALDMPKNIKKRLDGEKKKRADLEERLASGAEKDKKFAVKKLSKTVDSFLLAVEVVNSSIAKCVDATVQKAHASYSCRGVRNELIRAQDDLDDANQQLTQLKREMNDREDERDRGKKKNEKVEERVGQVQERVGGEQAMNDLFRKFTSEISNGNSMSLDDLEHKAAEIRGQLNATVENPQLMRRYEATTAELEAATVKLREMVTQYETADATFRQRLEKWQSSVTEIARRLHSYFSKYMSELQYRGSVELVQQGSLKDYEMQMYVSFRDNMDEHKLSGQRHSGGERAVSTIMYLMALQELTTAPFRVVDEINQGMDERNERLVFDRIVRSCSTSPTETNLMDRLSSSSSSLVASSAISSVLQKPQYFLVSPKLLEGLRAMDNNDVTVLLVWNGPGVASKWQFGDILSSLRKRKARGEEDGEEEEVEVKPVSKRAR